MRRLSNRKLLAAFTALREVDEARNIQEFRTIVPDILCRLFVCDRANYNDFVVTTGVYHIVPNPTPVWWPKFKELYAAHVRDHPLVRTRTDCHRSVTLSRHAQERVWKNSPLLHDYFRPLRVNDQLSTMIERRSGGFVGIAVNRVKGAYTPEDQALMDLVSPVLESRLSFLKRQEPRPQPDGQPLAAAVELTTLTPREREILKWIAAGKRNSEIACILQVSNRTVEKHVENLLGKLNVETRTSAAGLYISSCVNSHGNLVESL